MSNLAVRNPTQVKSGSKLPSRQNGISLIEVLIATVIAGILVIALSNVVKTTLDSGQTVHFENETLQQARFAMERMTGAAIKSRQLRLPLEENPSTKCNESVRGDTSDSDASNNCNDVGVMAVALDPTLDRNKDGWADANNDRDFLDVNKNGSRDAGEPERIDEDIDFDSNNDGKPGIKGIDDNGDVVIDEGNGAMATHDDDEDGNGDEDVMNDLDDDGDGLIDEDPFLDMNGDGMAGVIGKDDDLDGAIDEVSKADDDEDGLQNEDWVDEQVFYLNGTTLLERMPNIGAASGADFTEYPIAENVTQFLVKRLLGADGRTTLVEIDLTMWPSGCDPLKLNDPLGCGPVSLNTKVAVGSGL